MWAKLFVLTLSVFGLALCNREVNLTTQLDKIETKLDTLLRRQQCTLQQIKQQRTNGLHEAKQLTHQQLSACPAQSNASSKPYNSSWIDCSDVFKAGYRYGGIFWIKPIDCEPAIQVYCDNNPFSGGWTVFQRRLDGSISFNRTWTEYKNGFGSLDGEFWLGNEVLFAMTSNRVSTLKISLWTFDDEYFYREYKEFQINSEAYSYELRFDVNSTTGNLPDSASHGFPYHHGQKFSTHDNDNDEHSSLNCAAYYNSGFWFHNCGYIKLNGLYSKNESVSAYGIIWFPRFGSRKSMKHVEMKLRPTEF